MLGFTPTLGQSRVATWNLNPQGHYATGDTVPDESISRTDTSKRSEGMSLGKLFGKVTPASTDDGIALADFLVEV